MGAPERAVGLYAEFIARKEAGEGPEFEEFVRANPDVERELRLLHEGAHLLSGKLREPASLTARLEERYGSEVDPGVQLEDESPAADLASEIVERLSSRGEGYGRYKLKGEIDRGGQGAVLRVWDEDLRRNLAMKIMLGQLELQRTGDTPPVDSKTLGRFLEEAQVTGQLDHPGIVPVHELGLDAEGRVYFTMKLVKGRDLKAIFDLVHEDREGWTVTRALSVLLKVCEAMSYAHSKQVIHRDLKPANVMVGRFGEVYVMDWGLARVIGKEDEKDIRIKSPGMTSTLQSERREKASALADSPLITMDGDVVGTPAYMSPEQARGDLDAMGPHSDVYSLGAMLYHLLAGHMPYVPPDAAVNNYAVWQRAQEGPPRGLDELDTGAPPELVAICERAMMREVRRRYQSVDHLGDDLRAYLENRVVSAYRTGAWQEMRSWIRRNRPLFGTGLAAAAAVLVLLGGVFFQLDRERRRAELAVAAERGARYANSLEAVSVALRSKSPETAWLRLEQCPESLRGWEWSHAALITGALAYDEGSSTAEYRVVWSPDGERVVSTMGGYAASLIDPASGRRVAVVTHDGWITDLSWSSDGRRLATGGTDRKIRIWDSLEGELLTELRGLEDSVDRVEWSPTGPLLASESNGDVRVWDADAGTLVVELESAELTRWSPDGSVLACVGDEQIVLWRSGTGEVELVGDVDPDELLWHPDGSQLAWIDYEEVGIWDLARGEFEVFEDVQARHGELAWNPDGTRLACAASRQVMVRDHEARSLVATLEGSQIDERTLAWSPDGRYLAWPAARNRLLVWDAGSGEATTLHGHLDDVLHVGWNATGTRLASLSDDHSVHVWNPESTAAPLELTTSESWPVDFGWDPQGERLAVVSEGGHTTIWDAETGGRLQEVQSPELEAGTDSGVSWTWPWIHAAALGEKRGELEDDGDVLGIWWSPTGPQTVCAWEAIRIVTPDEGGPELVGHEEDVVCVDVLPDGRLVSGSEDATARLWTSGESIVLEGHLATVTAVAWGPSAKVMATGSADGTTCIWDTKGRLLQTLQFDLEVDIRQAVAGFVSQNPDFQDSGAEEILEAMEVQPITDVSWRPDGSALATADEAGVIRIWSRQGGLPESTLIEHAERVTSLAWSPSGDLLASASEDGAVQLWDGEKLEALKRLQGHESGVGAIAWHPSGTRLASLGYDNQLVIWDMEGMHELLSCDIFPDRKKWDDEGGWTRVPVELSARSGLGLEWSPDGQRLALWKSSIAYVLDERREEVVARWQAWLAMDRAEMLEEQDEEQARMIARVVDQLFEEELLLAAVLGRIDSYPALSASDRLEVRRVAQARGDPNPSELNERAWALVNPFAEPKADVAEGLRLARAAITLAAGDPSVHDTLGWALFANGDPAGARAELEQAVQLADSEAAEVYRKGLEFLQELNASGPRTGHISGGGLRLYRELNGVKFKGNRPLVRAGLDWLRRHQRPDGSWDCDGFEDHCPSPEEACGGPGWAPYDVGVSGLALLAFLGAGHAPGEGEHGAAVQSGVDWLMEQQDAESGLLGARESKDFIYNHALATQALCEAYLVAPNAELGRTCRKAVRFILAARSPYGAWRYDVPPIGDNDTSITGWMLLALRAALDARLSEGNTALRAEVQQACEGGLAWIDEVTDPATGRVGYDDFGRLSNRYPANEHFPREKGEGLTGVGLLCRLLLGQGPTGIHVKHAQLMLISPPEWEPENFGCDMTYWFFGTHAMFQMGGAYWRRWNKDVREVLRVSQRKDGDSAGSWDPVGPWGHAGGRVYSTAMMTLCAEAQGRYPRGHGRR